MSTSPRLTALEVASGDVWFKSSHSGDNGAGGCVSVAALPDHVGFRDSKQPNGPAVVVPTTSWSAFIREVRAGRMGR
ncbi:DUF397 domain-containing protein [Streptomyces eurocidicus]|uniref:DUF397 domain-containing protein n=1 Tax=Streptomyces eurocidicus TaxID=66423 RepID=A0A7W8F2U9_STREU|nr:DUF397 domain-containing protein [Streptomyces eurocidicus]MBB5119957.1 hypothetical protein [Streptomyces eurocidicus]MBF6051783.1 DUF397 domain-containing protein [Streptomyces eurocidicus]